VLRVRFVDCCRHYYSSTGKITAVCRTEIPQVGDIIHRSTGDRDKVVEVVNYARRWLS